MADEASGERESEYDEGFPTQLAVKCIVHTYLLRGRGRSEIVGMHIHTLDGHEKNAGLLFENFK